MYDFYGQHKSSANISLGGATKKVNKSDLLQSARAERFKREQTRRENNAALLIQSWYHGCRARKALAEEHRSHFNVQLAGYKNGQEGEDGGDTVLVELIKSLSLFYRQTSDYPRLVSLCQILLKLVSSKQLAAVVSSDLSGWVHRLKKILVLCCGSLHSSGDTNITIPLRMLEVFTQAETYTWLEPTQATKISLLITIYLVLKGYFKDLYRLIDAKIPSSLEPSPTPPTPFASAAKDLVLKPLTLLHKHSTVTTDIKSRLAYSTFTRDMLSPPMSEQVCFFVIPAVSPSLPLSPLLQAIKSTDETHTVWTLYSVLSIFSAQADLFPGEDVILLVHCIKILVPTLIECSDNSRTSSTGVYDSDSDDSDMDTNGEEAITKVPGNPCLAYVKETCFQFLNSKQFVTVLLSWLSQRSIIKDHSDTELRTYVKNLSEIAYSLLWTMSVSVHKSKLLTTLAFDRSFLRMLWEELTQVSTKTISGKASPLLHQLSLGHPMCREDESRILPLLGSFVVLFRYTLFSIYDSDFYHEKAGTGQCMMPFSLSEVIEMSGLLINVVLGLICFIYPDIKVHYSNDEEWKYLCEMVTQLVKQLYSRDSRHKFCPENHWLSPRAAISIEKVNVSEYLQDQEMEEGEVASSSVTSSGSQFRGMSTISSRNLAILKYIPFAVPFLHRVEIFQKIVEEDRSQSQSTEQRVMTSASLNITVNRKYLYQDAYDQLSQDRTDDIKKVIRVTMVNAQGLEEAGIDGGGVFREFMSQLVKTGFDPSYGFFKTTSEQLLYPNPDVGVVHQDYQKHLHFLGRMLGKIVYEFMMVELPLAEFFLCKLLNRYGSDVDIYHLESLDPELYKNLLYLKNYEGDADDLALNFTVMNDDYGEAKCEELKPGGRDVCVTNANKIEYIHLVADYRLNKQIRSHVNAFRAGLSEVINIEWIQMFDHRELQILISGAPVPIDMDELRTHTNYSGDFNADDEYIQEFWNVVSSFTEKQKCLFLKFVTSCSRPPLLGFSELYPKFCIHSGGESEDRLPTASTCMNFLKLPRYKSYHTLKNKLIYAIEAQAGFELS